MTDIILHHYETSPYAEKVRLGLGLKGLAWASVEIPVIMPKPDLTALTGGYRNCGAAAPSRNSADREVEDSFRVKGGCRRQVDGTAGLPSAPEMPCAPRQLRLVPQH